MDIGPGLQVGIGCHSSAGSLLLPMATIMATHVCHDPGGDLE